ncbi:MULTISPECIES: acyl-homoserine-lactone synthase [unclassified Lentilitoribacter]|uniref:acyl-homoserine-lactone synthase n=1 Tax=unclassified Lentilitoribacter TaxID=2647570 RepID=UPI0013A6E60A|nr:acyl-homoserine-lactone synthase [Lentilitoribacter sp. Alg239-R112]
MFITIQAHEYHKYPELMDQMFRLRKRVFADQLGWDVPVIGEYEKDVYDNHQPAYLMWCDNTCMELYAVVRLMPTTGPTLLYDVFRKTFPNVVSFEAPGIWEATRMCMDMDSIKADHPDMVAGRASALMLIAMCETGLAHGIHTMISNYEPQMKRIYQRSGAAFSELGRADGYGKRPVCCGQFEISQTVLSSMREKLTVTEPLYVTSKPERNIASYFSHAA